MSTAEPTTEEPVPEEPQVPDQPYTGSNEPQFDPDHDPATEPQEPKAPQP